MGERKRIARGWQESLQKKCGPTRNYGQRMRVRGETKKKKPKTEKVSRKMQLPSGTWLGRKQKKKGKSSATPQKHDRRGNRRS